MKRKHKCDPMAVVRQLRERIGEIEDERDAAKAREATAAAALVDAQRELAAERARSETLRGVVAMTLAQLAAQPVERTKEAVKYTYID